MPEERLGHSAVPGFVLSDNVLLTRHASGGTLVRAGFVDQSGTRTVADRVMERFDVRTSGANPPARALSGGNLQKFVVGRELDREPAVLVIDQPTWGVDAGAAALIRQALLDMAENGAAVLVISQDLDEIFEIADRIAVISRGELSAAYPAREIDRERVGLLMAGAHESGERGGESHGTSAHDQPPRAAGPHRTGGSHRAEGRDSGSSTDDGYATQGRDHAAPAPDAQETPGAQSEASGGRKGGGEAAA